MPRSALVAALATILLTSPACGRDTPDSWDPATMDPPVVDPAFPPRMVETGIDSHGSRLNAILYLAQGSGEHPAVILLHGYPGNEKNLDLAQALRRAGIHVLFFHYRGSWGSEGEYGLAHNVEDVVSALALLRSEEAVEEYRIDTTRISLVGHSLGGFTALLVAARDESIRCTVSIAGINLGRLHPMMLAGPEAFAAVAGALQAGTGPLRGTSGEALAREISSHGAEFDLLAQIDALSQRQLLLIGGERDTIVPLATDHRPLVEALKAGGSERMDQLVLDTDHAFSGKRIALARAVIGWLQGTCGF